MPNQEDTQTLSIASAKPVSYTDSYYPFSALGLCTAWCPQVQSLLDYVEMGRWMRTRVPAILCTDFDPTTLLSASCLFCLMSHLVLSSSEWLGGLLDMLAHFSKISLLWSFGCAHLWLSGNPTPSVFHLRKNCCSLWFAHVTTIFFSPCDLISFVFFYCFFVCCLVFFLEFQE